MKTARSIAIKATNRALEKWGGDRNRITHVVFHSCTGFKAPGIELDIVDECSLSGVKRRLGINFMGCFGGFTGMAVAKAFVEADPGALVLLVCAEVCSVHFTTTEDRSRAIGNSVFADGAAAVIIGAGKPGDWVISGQSTHTLGKETRDFMTWLPGNGPYQMFLSKEIGGALGKKLLPLFLQMTVKLGFRNIGDIEWCIHPGGRKFLDIFGDMMALGGRKNLEHSYEILREYGNMSSPTIFFVLQRMMEKQEKQGNESRKTHAVCMGFGPGLTVEVTTLQRAGGTSSGVANCGGEVSVREK